MSGLANVTAARVGDRAISLESLIHTMKITDRLADFRHAVDDLLIQSAAEGRGIAPSDADLQTEADNLRVALGLHDDAATRAWLKARSMSQDEFETYVLRIVSARHLKRELTADKAEAYFMENRPGFDAARISRLAFGGEDEAREAMGKLTSGAATMASLAGRFSADPSEAPSDGAGFVLRMNMDPALAVAVFRASPGQVVGPVKTARGAYELAQVHEVRRAELDDRTAALVGDLIFGVWIRGERERVGIEVLVPSLVTSA